MNISDLPLIDTKTLRNASVIALTGRRASGKSILADYLVSEINDGRKTYLFTDSRERYRASMIGYKIKHFVRLRSEGEYDVKDFENSMVVIDPMSGGADYFADFITMAKPLNIKIIVCCSWPGGISKFFDDIDCLICMGKQIVCSDTYGGTHGAAIYRRYVLGYEIDDLQLKSILKTMQNGDIFVMYNGQLYRYEYKDIQKFLNWRHILHSDPYNDRSLWDTHRQSERLSIKKGIINDLSNII